MVPATNSKHPVLLYRLLATISFLVISIVVARSAGWVGTVEQVEVEIVSVGRQTVTHTVTAYGILAPAQEIVIRSELPGEIITCFVQAGDTVAPGDVLLTLRTGTIQARINQRQAEVHRQKALHAEAQAQALRAKAVFIQAKLAHQRQQQLHKQQVIATAELEQHVANYQTAQQDYSANQQWVKSVNYQISEAEASLQELLEQRAQTIIYAPIAGIITKHNAQVGERVTATAQQDGTELFHLADYQAVVVRVNISEEEILSVEVGDTARVQLEPHGRQPFHGVVSQVGFNPPPSYGYSTTEFPVEIKLLPSTYADSLRQQGKTPFREGMNATVHIISEQKNNVLAVPLLAATTRPIVPNTIASDTIQEVVFIYQEGKVEQRSVTLGLHSQHYIEVLDGLTEGEAIVAKPYRAVSELLKDGLSVTTGK